MTGRAWVLVLLLAAGCGGSGAPAGGGGGGGGGGGTPAKTFDGARDDATLELLRATDGPA